MEEEEAEEGMPTRREDVDVVELAMMGLEAKHIIVLGITRDISKTAIIFAAIEVLRELISEEG